MRNFNIRKDDQRAVMHEIGPVVAGLLREAVDEGFSNFTLSRNRDPDAYPEYSDCTRANMLYDRIAECAREFVDAAKGSQLSWRITRNKRATDIFLDTRFAFRIKRSKRNRGGCTTSVATRRQRRIKSDVMLPWGQMVLDFPTSQILVADQDRIWLTVTFDLDDLEETITQVAIGVELRKRFLWRIPLPAPDADVLASFPPLLADRISELRDRRSA